MHLLAKLTRSELRLFLREPIAVFFTLAFPSVLVAILGSVPALRAPDPNLGGARFIDVYVPIVIGLAVGVLGLQVMPGILATYRERGVLRRLSTTPVPPRLLLGAQLLVSLLTAVVSTVLVVAVGRFAFDVPLPRQAGAFVLAFLAWSAAVAAIGLFVAAVVPGGKAANAVGSLLFFPLMFFGGLWVPREAMAGWLRRIGDFTPMGAGNQALQDAVTGSWPAVGSLAVLAAYLLIFGAAAARLFRWE